jgi:hypothetical protein
MYRRTREIEIGRVPVDSGTVAIGDPCYLIENKGSRRQVYWEDVVNALYDDKGRAREGVNETSAIELHGHFITGTPDGDGTFPVYAEVDESGQVHALRIDLNDEPEMCSGCDWPVSECTCHSDYEEEDPDGD